jgi:hypothetical protein
MEDPIMLLIVGWLLQLLFWVGLPILGLVWIVVAIRRSTRAASEAFVAATGGAGVGDLLGQFLRAIREAQRAFDDLPASSEAERRAKQAMILQLLSGISSQYGRINSHAQSRYSPTIASLHSMAAQNGIDWTPPNS